MKKQKDRLVQADILRYKKNKFPALLALLGLVFNCLYFCLLYAVKEAKDKNEIPNRWASIEIGISVLLTLFVLLFTFLSSEGIKGYRKNFAIPLLIIGAFQFFRIFFYPIYGLKMGLLNVPYFWIYPTTSTFEFIMMLIWLCASGACLIASAVLGYIQCLRLEKHIKKVENGEIDMDAYMKELDEKSYQASEESAVAEAEPVEQPAEVVAEADGGAEVK